MADSFSIVFDYTYDVRGFFELPARRAALEAAAAAWAVHIADDFATVRAGSRIQIANPSAPGSIVNHTVGSNIDDLLIFVGSVDLGGWRETASARVITAGHAQVLSGGGDGDAMDLRISADFRGQGPATDYEPFAASITFNDNPGLSWWTGAAAPAAGTVDLLSTAIHEIGHALGLVGSPTYEALVAGAFFTGQNAARANGGAPVPLEGDGHIRDGFAGNRTVMDPADASGTRKYPSEIDLAMLADIGYEIAGTVAAGTPFALATQGDDDGIFGSTLADTIDGLAGDDWIQGNSGADLLLGGAGNDTIFGQGGADTIAGGAGDDILLLDLAETGRDTVLFARGDGADTVQGFSAANDTVRLSGALGFATPAAVAAAIQVGATAYRIAFPSGESLVFDRTGGAAAGLSAANFVVESGASALDTAARAALDPAGDAIWARFLATPEGAAWAAARPELPVLHGAGVTLTALAPSLLVGTGGAAKALIGTSGADAFLSTAAQTVHSLAPGTGNAARTDAPDLVLGSVASLAGDSIIAFGTGDAIFVAGSAIGTVSIGPQRSTVFSVAGGGLSMDFQHDETLILEISDDGSDTWIRHATGTAIALGAGSGRFISQASDDLRVDGAAGDDFVQTGSGDDRIGGGAGSDLLRGGSGEDTLFGGAGSDILVGGAGADDFVFLARDASGFSLDRIEDFEPGRDRILLSGIGSYTWSVITGDAALVCDTGQIVVLSGIERDAVRSGDIVSGPVGSFAVAAPGTVFLSDAPERYIIGGSLAEVVRAGGGADAVVGGDGADRLLGEAGSDVLTGGGGADTLEGGTGSDVLIGNGGADRFVFGLPETGFVTDTIRDFEIGIDRVELVAGTVPVVIAAGADTMVQIGASAYILFEEHAASAISASLGNIFEIG